MSPRLPPETTIEVQIECQLMPGSLSNSIVTISYKVRPTYWPCLCSYYQTSMMSDEYVLTAADLDNTFSPPIMRAASHSNPSALKAIIKYGASLDEKQDRSAVCLVRLSGSLICWLCVTTRPYWKRSRLDILSTLRYFWKPELIQTVFALTCCLGTPPNI